MDDAELIAQVERRPAIWDPRTEKNSNARQNYRAAWRQLCKLQHPDFDKLPPADKRDKCLTLQKRWLQLRNDYYRHRRQEDTGGLFAKMTFLADTAPGTDLPPNDVDAASAKRPRSNSAAPACTTPPPPEADENRHFLLSLVSHMEDVPRRDRLALRRDMLALVAKYAGGPPDNASTSTSN